jgi:lipoprotein-releasing system ATP-binding protein
MDAEPALRCHEVERFLGEDENRVHALRGVSLALEPGSVHAVVGPSGCGKSSLLYVLGLLDRPDAGWIEVESQNVSEFPDHELSRLRRELIGFIFQFHFLLEEFTAAENIMIPMRRLGILNEEQMQSRAAELLDEVGLRAKAQRPSRHLSGGEQQRVAIARALANNPRVILADEPTGNLDTENSRRAFELLERIAQEERKAALIVTHNPEIAERCARIHHMEDGVIVATHFGNSRRG